MTEAPDEELMLAYRGGDARAFETLYSRHRARLFRFVLRSIKVRALAEELYQEVWMRVIEARASYKPSARFTTWLYTIAHNRLVDHWRRGGLPLVSLDDHDATSSTPDPAHHAEARGDARALRRGAREAAAGAARGLPAARRSGLSVPEIAAATASNEEAAKSRLRYAMAKLKAALDDG
jgi:RNA polymerase sigma-70 factor (ECF subfamily)